MHCILQPPKTTVWIQHCTSDKLMPFCCFLCERRARAPLWGWWRRAAAAAAAAVPPPSCVFPIN
jgi:hypothetical protein